MKIINKIAARVPSFLTRLFAKSGDPLLNGDVKAYAAKEYPPEDYPTVWQKIPADIRRSLVWDGRLLNGRAVVEIAKRHLTPLHVAKAVALAGGRALLVTAVIAILFALNIVFVAPSTMRAVTQGVTPYPQWADGVAIQPILLWYVLTTIERVWAVVGIVLQIAWPLVLLFPALWFFGTIAALVRWWDRISDPLRKPSRDSVILWNAKAATRPVEYQAYCRQVENATTRLKHQPFIAVGAATGVLRARGDMEAPNRGQIIGWDGESLRQHTIAMGGTGEGKTRLFLRPAFEAIMNADWGDDHRMGAFVIDGKGTLHHSLARTVGHRDDVVTLGIGKDEFGVDLLRGMTPLEVSTTFKAVSGQVAGKPSDDFWPESASLLLMHSATIALVLDMDEPTVAEWIEKKRCRPYSLIGIALIASDEGVAKAAIDLVSNITKRELGAAVETDISDEVTQRYMQAMDSVAWMRGSFLPMANETKSSIIANVNVTLGKLSGSPELSERFCTGAFEQTVDVDHALYGGIVFVAVGEAEHGMAGKVISCWLKTRLYVLARRRLADDPQGCAENSCAVIADEFQMLATTGQDSDSSFWNIARETGVFLIAATQSLAALKQVMGAEATDNLINLLRSKIILKTEEISTLEYARRLAGESPRGWEIEDHHYSTQGQREIAEPDLGSDDIDLGFWAGFPRSLTFSKESYSLYSLPNIKQSIMSALTSPYTYQDLRNDTFRIEDKNRSALIEGLQFRPKLEIDELLIGAGNAFAVVQRAGLDRMDIIDLETTK